MPNPDWTPLTRIDAPKSESAPPRLVRSAVPTKDAFQPRQAVAQKPASPSTSGSNRELRRLATLPQYGGKGHSELRITLNEWSSSDGTRRTRYVQFRIFIMGESGKWAPTKQGITLRRGDATPELLRSLTRAFEEMNQ
jgi:hypothetical protein